jgi:hypothetical protein
MLLEQLMPRFDATRVEHRLISAGIEETYAATVRADFMRAWRESVAVRFLFAARTVGERAVSLVARRDFVEPPAPATMRLSDMTGRGEWVQLGDEPPREVVFGAVGRFWGGETAWERIDPDAFANFNRPGFARIACNFSLRRYGAGQTLLSYECRTQATDDAARRAFLRYWRPLSPFIGVVLRSQLRVIAQEARHPA